MTGEQRKPWMKWYPADWRADPRLRMCGLAARGLWADMLSLMHEAEPYGHLLVSGTAPTDRQLAKLVGCTEKECRAALDELKEAGVYSLTVNGVVYSRRMVRDFDKAQKDRSNGKGGGNPNIVGWVNPPLNPDGTNPDNPGDNASHGRDLEARGQRTKPNGFERAGAPPKRGSRLPEGWGPGPELVAWTINGDAETNWPGLDSGRLIAELDKFRDHWRQQPGQKGVKLDWDAAWRNWCRRAVEDAVNRPHNYTKSAGNFL